MAVSTSAPEHAHTKTADDTRGLRGEFQRPIKITFLGAGSVFTPRLLRDVLQIPGMQGGQIALVDIDTARLGTVAKLIEKLIDEMGLASQWSVQASPDRKKVLGASDYVVSCVEVSGLDCVAWDNDIPLKYGVDQCIGDTIGPGGLFKGLRTIPVFLDILRDMRELCPKALMLNYTNPMSMMCLAAGRAVPEISVVGLCHSVQGTSHLLAEYAGVPYEKLQWECAGINHLSWFTKLEHQGQNLYTTTLYEKFAQQIREGIEEAEAGLTRYDDADVSLKDKKGQEIAYQHEDLVRKDMCVNFGAFITESSGHLSEYLPYYRKSDAGRKLLRLSYHGGSRYYASNWPTWRKDRDEDRQSLLRGEQQMDWQRTWEYASWIIEAREKDVPYRIHGNVMNHTPGSAHGSGSGAGGGEGKLISNLPGDGCVEVACMIDGNGIHPTRFGALPPQMAAICASNMSMFDLGAKAAIEKSKEAAIHALMLDPLCAAVCTPGEIREMAYEMFEAQKDFLVGYE